MEGIEEKPTGSRQSQHTRTRHLVYDRHDWSGEVQGGQTEAVVMRSLPFRIVATVNAEGNTLCTWTGRFNQQCLSGG